MGPNSFVFAYIFTKKRPRRRSTPPPTGNPGSATVRVKQISLKSGLILTFKVHSAIHLVQVYRTYTQIMFTCLPLADPGGRRRRAPPQQDQFLSFSHMFLLKSVCVRGWCPPNGSAPPQREILDPPLVGILEC